MLLYFFSIISNLRSGPILTAVTHSVQRLTSLALQRPDFGRNADWLLEQCHKIWLAVGINGSWKRLFLAWLISRMIGRRRREGSILLSFLIFLWSYSRKIYLNMCYGNSENSDACSCLLRSCFIYGTINVRMWVYRRPRTMCLLIYQQTSAHQNTVHLKNGLIWKFSRE